MKPKKKIKYHHGDLRQSIINAVAQLIKEQRSLDFQLKDVARLVGTSQPAIYKHFSGKKELIIEVAVAGYQLQRNLRETALKEAKECSLAKIKAMGDSFFEFAKFYSGYFLLIKNLETEEILSSKRYLAERKLTVETITKTTRDCIGEGLFLDIDLSVVVVTLNAAAFGLSQVYVAGLINLIPSKHNDDEFIKQVFNLQISALLTEKGKLAYSKLK